jgi:hypothetical protein
MYAKGLFFIIFGVPFGVAIRVPIDFLLFFLVQKKSLAVNQPPGNKTGLFWVHQ